MYTITEFFVGLCAKISLKDSTENSLFSELSGVTPQFKHLSVDNRLNYNWYKIQKKSLCN